MERLTELLGYWNHSLPEKVDYADLVFAPAFARGYRMVYEDEYGYMVEDTIKALEELQQYKDTGLTSEQIMEIDKLYAEKCRVVAELKEDISQLNDDCAGLSQENELFKAEIENLKESIKAEESGLLLRLPCRVGDIVYSDSKYFGILAYEVNSIHIGIGISFEAIASRDDEMLDAIDFDIEDIGKTVFLTREEAEAKLAEMEKNNEQLKNKYGNLDAKFTKMMTDYENKITDLKIEIARLKEKEVAKKPILIKRSFTQFYVCPGCSTNEHYEKLFSELKYCCNCGQKLDWEGKDE